MRSSNAELCYSINSVAIKCIVESEAFLRWMNQLFNTCQQKTIFKLLHHWDVETTATAYGMNHLLVAANIQHLISVEWDSNWWESQTVWTVLIFSHLVYAKNFKAAKRHITHKCNRNMSVNQVLLILVFLENWAELPHSIFYSCLLSTTKHLNSITA